jgi:hypothetical protein
MLKNNIFLNKKSFFRNLRRFLASPYYSVSILLIINTNQKNIEKFIKN